MGITLTGLHPGYWSISDVREWLAWAVREFSLTDINQDQFNLNGEYKNKYLIPINSNSL